MKEFEKRHFLTSSNLTDSNSQYTDRNLMTNNSVNNATWQNNLAQPRFQPQQVFSQHGPLPQPPALYAVPIPRSQRSRLNDLYTSSPRTPTSSVNSGQSQTRHSTHAEPIYSNEVLQNLVDTLTEEFANENVQSYLEGTTTFVDEYYSNLYNINNNSNVNNNSNLYNVNSDERISQSSSTNTADGQQQQQQQQREGGTIKSILKKRENVSNENLDGSEAAFGAAARTGSSSTSGSSCHASQELKVIDDEEKFRETEERLLTDLSPSHVFLETR